MWQGTLRSTKAAVIVDSPNIQKSIPVLPTNIQYAEISSRLSRYANMSYL